MSDEGPERLVAPSRVQAEMLLFDEPVAGFHKVEFTGNALLLMKDREVSRREVLAAIRNPDEEGLATQPGRRRVRWNKTYRVAIDVVYEELEDRIRVITALKADRRPSHRRKS